MASKWLHFQRNSRLLDGFAKIKLKVCNDEMKTKVKRNSKE